MATSHLNSIKIWDIRNPNSPQHYINAHPSKIYALDFSPVKENQLVSSAADNTIKMWNVSKPQKPVNILKVRDGSPVWKVKYTVCQRITLFIMPTQCTEMRFSSFLSGGFTMAVINPPERKLAKRTSVHCAGKMRSYLGGVHKLRLHNLAFLTTYPPPFTFSMV